MLDNSHKAVGNDSCTDLYSNSILSSTLELLDLKVLLKPPKKQLYVPSVFIKINYLKDCQFHWIS